MFHDIAIYLMESKSAGLTGAMETIFSSAVSKCGRTVTAEVLLTCRTVLVVVAVADWIDF